MSEELVEMAGVLDMFAERAHTEARWSPQEIVVTLAEIRELRTALANLATDLERVYVEVAPRRLLVDGLGEVEIKKAKKYTDWDNDGLTRRLVGFALDERKLDEMTGEYEPSYEAVARVLSECSRPSWRVTALRQHGIQEDEWCHVEEGALSVRLPPRKDNV